MFFGSKKVIGLDIGTSTIKLAELNVTNTGAELISFGFTPTPNNSINGGEIANAAAISVAIAALVAEVKTKRKYASIGMWGTSVIIKKITIPKIEAKLIDDQIKWEAEQYIPFDVNDISLSYHIIDSSATSETMDILLIAAQRAVVKQYASTITSAKLQVGVIDVSGFALANTFELNYGKFPNETIALLNVGAGNTNFVVIHNGQVVFCRDIPMGGNNYTGEIQKELGISFSEAESMKLSAVARSEVPEEVHTILNSTNDSFTDEVRNSFDFFSASSIGLTISKCYYSGGGAGMPGLVDKISEMANISLEPINPFKRIKPASHLKVGYLQKIAAYSPLAIGLGIRKVDDK